MSQIWQPSGVWMARCCNHGLNHMLVNNYATCPWVSPGILIERVKSSLTVVFKLILFVLSLKGFQPSRV